MATATALTGGDKVWLEGAILVGVLVGQGTAPVELREFARKLGSALGVRTRHACRGDHSYMVELPDGNARAAAARAVQGVTISLTLNDTATDCIFTPRDITIQDVDLFIMKMRAGSAGGVLSAEEPGNPMRPGDWMEEVHGNAQEEQRRLWAVAGAGGLLQGMLLNPGAQPEHLPTVNSLSDEEMRLAIQNMQQLLLQRAAGTPRPPPTGPIPPTSPHPGGSAPNPAGTGTPSTPFQSLDGWTLSPQKPLRFRIFSGPEKLKPDHATWEQWRREVLLAQGQYPENAVKESMERSLVGDPLEISQGFPLDLSVAEMLTRLEDFFGPVQELDQVRSSFHQIQMKTDERVSELVTRIEMWARRVNAAAGREEIAPVSMKSRLFHALRDPLKAQVRHLKDNPDIDYKELVRYLRVVESGADGSGRTVRKAAAVKLHQVDPVEHEVEEEPTPTPAPVAMESPTVVQNQLPQLDVAQGGLDLQQAVIQAVAAQIASQFGLRPGTTQDQQQQRGGQKRTKRGGRGRGRGGGSTMPSTTTPANARVQNRDLICHLCGGAGHMARSCSSQAGTEQGNAQGDQVMGASQAPAPQVQGQAAPQAPQRSSTQ